MKARRTHWTLTLLAASLSAFPAFAESPAGSAASTRVDTFRPCIDKLRDAAASPLVADDKVNRMAFDTLNVGMPSSAIEVGFQKRHWHTAAPTGTPATIDRIMRAGWKARLDSGKVPSPELAAAENQADAIYGRGGISFGPLEEKEAAVYRYKKDSRSPGVIVLNDRLADITVYVADLLLYMPVVHEGRHGYDHRNDNLSPEKNREGELPAFVAEAEELERTTHDGEEIGTTRIALMELMRSHPTRLVKRALDYVSFLDGLFGIRRDKEAIKKYIQEHYPEVQKDDPA